MQGPSDYFSLIMSHKIESQEQEHKSLFRKSNSRGCNKTCKTRRILFLFRSEDRYIPLVTNIP